MKVQLLLTLVGEDRPGIVASLTETLVKYEANLEDSRMAILGGEFAAIMLVTLPDRHVESLNKALSHLQSEGLAVSAKITKPLSPDRFEGYSLQELSVSGADHEGIVYKVSQFLRDRSVNIESMETDVIPAPVTGSPLFRMKATILVPASVTSAELNRQLSAIGEEESVEISVTPAVKEQVGAGQKT
ncbi:MAG TPA: ACT domain-containing protein [Candidatus Obscuribacterales bacterium]